LWTLRSPSPTRLHAVAVLGPLVLAALAVGAVFWANRAADNREAWVRHTDQVEYAISDLDGAITDAAYGCRGWVLLGDSAERARYAAAVPEANQREAEIRALTVDNAVQQRHLDTLDRDITREFGMLARAAGLATSGQRAAATDLLRAGGAQDSALTAIHGLTDRLTAEEERLHAIRVKAEHRQRLESALILLLGVGLAVLVSVLMSALLARAAVQEAALAADLRAANDRLSEQAVELELQAQSLEEQAGELEAANESLEEQAVELEQANEELMSTTEQLAERSEAAEAANRAKSEFLTRMSHELRTPLNAITGYASLLNQGVRGPVTDVQQEDLSRIQRAAQHLLGLINDVLNFARIEVGRVQFDIGAVPAALVVTEAAAMIEPLAQARGLAFSRGSSDGLVVKADHERAVQIVINLLTNAVKFTQPGGRVELSTTASNARIEIAVTDTGRGIPAEALGHIFDPFVQVGRSMTPAGGGDGLGLGLAISRELARAMGGDLRVASEVGRGSVFTLELPQG
jgi:signal transduction histidine kinase